MIKFTTSNEQFPAIDGDEYSDPLTEFKSTNEFDDVEWTVNFEIEDGPASETFTITNIKIDDINEGLKNNISESSVSFSGKVVNIFDGDFFDVVIRDTRETRTKLSKSDFGPTLEDMKNRTKINWATCVNWSRPSVKMKIISYIFLIKYIDDLSSEEFEDSITINQHVYWKLEPSLEYFNELTSSGDF
jgi:hypothetical protein